MQRSAVCDFLHGPLTSQSAVQVVRQALAAGTEQHFEILYYRKDAGPDVAPPHKVPFVVRCPPAWLCGGELKWKRIWQPLLPRIFANLRKRVEKDEEKSWLAVNVSGFIQAHHRENPDDARLNDSVG
ncbi:hypothetical protein ACFE04_019841 [Oxalis oulophora]